MRPVTTLLPLSLAVAAATPAQLAQAQALAQALALPLATAERVYPLLLWLTPERLELRLTGPDAPGPVSVDFVAGRLGYRRRHRGSEPLLRAVGLKGDQRLRIVDATAGLGRDAFMLACQGCRVQLLERSPVIAALVQDGLDRAARDPELGIWINERLQLSVADSRTWLSACPAAERPDVVYLDPMYPHRSKTALVKKDMRLLRELVGDDDDAPALLAAALACARSRVVVKRPVSAAPLAGPVPSFTLAAQNTRFDVYRLMTPKRVISDLP